jgi:5-methylcytosine-specific restriction endonuclease McrA
MTLDEYLANSTDIQTNKIRKKILQEGLKPHQCESCKLTVWLGQPIPLEVHHKDGDRNNNTFENYELLCPNCHAFTDSYRGKNSRK